MTKKLFKDKKTRYRNLGLVILPFVLVIAIFGFLAINSAKNLTSGGASTSLADSIDTMDYHLRANATDLQKEYFKELVDLCNVEASEKDKYLIARSVVKNFVADFYTWTNKAGSYDVGGAYFVHSPSKANILKNARDNFYKYVTHYINEYGRENLLEVTSVEIPISEKHTPTTYTWNNKEYDAYYFKATWTYADHDGFDESEYDTEQHFLVIENEDGRFEIVQAYGD